MEKALLHLERNSTLRMKKLNLRDSILGVGCLFNLYIKIESKEKLGKKNLGRTDTYSFSHNVRCLKRHPKDNTDFEFQCKVRVGKQILK